jgi:hypothetical protein
MKFVKFEVNRLYIAFGYYLEWYESVDGDRANSGLSELWVGKDDMPFKEFLVQADFSDNGHFSKEYLMQNLFAGAILDYNNKYDMQDEDALDVDGCGLREVTYEVTRYYVSDDYYFDVDTLDLYEADDGAENITIGKINYLSKVSLCSLDTSDGGLADAEDEVFIQILETSLEAMQGFFDIEDNTILDIDTLHEDELASEYNVYYTLSANEKDKDINDVDDEITFE